MSASPVFSSAAMSRPFIFSPRSSPRSPAEILARVGAIPKLAAVVPASRLEVRPAPEMVSSGIPQLDLLTGGLARGCLTEICGTASSGRTSVLLFALARATERGEVCALVDASDAFDPASAAAAGMEMSRLLWVRCGEKYPLRKHSSAALTGCEKTGGSSPAFPSGKPRDSYEGMSSGKPHNSYLGMPSGIPQGFREGHDRGLQQARVSPAGVEGFRACPERSRMGAVSPAQSSSALAAEDSRNLQRGKLSGWKNPETRRWESQLEQMLKVTDLLLQSNGFGMIALDLGDVPVESARRIPLASWFRFRRAIEHTPTALLVLEQQPIAGSCSSVLVKVSGARSQVSGKKLSAVSSQLSGNPPMHTELPHSELLDQFVITAELLCSRLERKLERKPVQSTASFKSRAAWVG
jgi:recombination protein RecA